jgi:hypothetical protein
VSFLPSFSWRDQSSWKTPTWFSLLSPSSQDQKAQLQLADPSTSSHPQTLERPQCKAATQINTGTSPWGEEVTHQQRTMARDFRRRRVQSPHPAPVRFSEPALTLCPSRSWQDRASTLGPDAAPIACIMSSCPGRLSCSSSQGALTQAVQSHFCSLPDTPAGCAQKYQGVVRPQAVSQPPWSQSTEGGGELGRGFH